MKLFENSKQIKKLVETVDTSTEMKGDFSQTRKAMLSRKQAIEQAKRNVVAIKKTYVAAVEMVYKLLKEATPDDSKLKYDPKVEPYPTKYIHLDSAPYIEMIMQQGKTPIDDEKSKMDILKAKIFSNTKQFGVENVEMNHSKYQIEVILNYGKRAV